MSILVRCSDIIVIIIIHLGKLLPLCEFQINIDIQFFM